MRHLFLVFSLLMVCLFYSFSSVAQARSTAQCVTTDTYQCLVVAKKQTWESLFPDPAERLLVKKINHSNQRLYAGRVIIVPRDLSSNNLLAYSPLPQTIAAPGEKLILVDLNKHAFGAYLPNGQLQQWGPVTGGSSWCRDIGRACRTKAGSFRIYSLGSRDCKSTKFPVPKGGAPMPYCMFFNGGQALHGSPGEVLRGNVSHGCVRLFVEDAEWIRFYFAEAPSALNQYRGTKVVVLPY